MKDEERGMNKTLKPDNRLWFYSSLILHPSSFSPTPLTVS
jgi:hypothetical protein